MAKTFKVVMKATQEVSAENIDEAFDQARKMLLRELGVANVNDEVVANMEERFTYTVTGIKDKN